MMKDLVKVSIGKNGMVSTPHPLATEAAIEILKKGGNAIDAAIAANTTLSVILPDQCGLGGDLFAVVYDPTDSKTPVHVLNGSGFSPEKATVEEMQKLGHKTMPQSGPLSVTVPGTVQAWGKMSEKWGKLPWTELFDNALSLAENGFIVNLPLSKSIHFCREGLTSSSASKLFTPGGIPLEPGQRLVQDRLANTIRIIKNCGWECFYKGDIGQAICQTVLSSGGLLSQDDLLNYSVEWIAPVSAEYRGYKVFTTPPNSRGVILLAVLDQLNKISLESYSYQSAEYISLMVRLFKNRMAQLEGLLGDPRFMKIPIDSWVEQPETPDTRDCSPNCNKLKGDTISLCVVDNHGMGVSLIQSVYHDFGSEVYVEPAGFFLQNRGASFNFEKDHPNCIAPRKRPLHTLMPSLVTKDNKLFMVFGTRGGAGQPQTLAQILSAVVDYGFSAQEAVQYPRWIYGSTTSARQTDGLIMESTLTEEVGAKLRQTGMSVQTTDPLSVGWMGCAQMIIVDQKAGIYYGGADPRGGGLADGY